VNACSVSCDLKRSFPAGVGAAGPWRYGRSYGRWMRFDPPTLFIIVVASLVVCTALLFWCFVQNRNERSLLWMSAAYLSAGIGNLLLAVRGVVPDILSIDIANALVLGGMCLGWAAMRIFNGNSISWTFILLGPFVWLAALRFPFFAESYEWRLIFASLIGAAYSVGAAKATIVNDGLRTRFPIAMLFLIHALFLAFRIPLAFNEMQGPTLGFESPWFTPLALEAIVFIQATAFLTVSLIKERTEGALRSAALTDPLTGLPNRRAFFDRGAAMIALGQRMGRPTSVIVFDLDRFKAVNDTYGHPVGDAVIEAFAVATRASLRVSDFTARIGGEEFASVLPDTDEAAAKFVADRVMRCFVDLVGDEAAGGAHCTTSAGLAVSIGSRNTIEAMFKAADRALYEAKRLGGNQLRTVQPALA
jgi:diguanylate cyclase (GGDEF)-like protein